MNLYNYKIQRLINITNSNEQHITNQRFLKLIITNIIIIKIEYFPKDNIIKKHMLQKILPKM